MAAPASYSSSEETEFLYVCSDASAAVAGVAAALASLLARRRLRGEGSLFMLLDAVPLALGDDLSSGERGFGQQPRRSSQTVGRRVRLLTSHLQCRLRTAIVTDQRRHKQGQKIGSSVRTNKEESMPVCH